MIIKEWDKVFPSDLNNNMCFSSLFIAPRYSGKTYLVEYLLKTSLKDKFNNIIVFSTMTGVKDYSKFIEGNLLFVGYKQQLIDTIRNVNAENQDPYNILVIMDDTNSRKEKFNSSIQELYTNGRHSNISIIYCTQSPNLVDNNWKMNSDLIFIFDTRTTHSREYIIKNLLSGILKDEDFEKSRDENRFYMKLLKDTTNEQHRCIVMNMRKRELTWFKAP